MIPYLTIDVTEEENTKLRERLAELKETHSKEWELVRQDKKQQAERDKQFRVEMNTKLYERNNDIAELKAAVAFLTDKVNAAVTANEPSSKVIFNQKGIATGIEIPAECKNTATCEIAKTS
jgi:hypothetical protein